MIEPLRAKKRRTNHRRKKGHRQELTAIKSMRAADTHSTITSPPLPPSPPSGPPNSTNFCGVPAPVLVKSIGGADKVSFDPPLILDCAMVVALDPWLKDSVQPAAREAFSSPVSKIIGSSYACRHVYNLPDGHLSQHAFANAIDLPMFVFADGRKVDVTHGWGPTERDLGAAAAQPFDVGSFPLKWHAKFRAVQGSLSADGGSYDANESYNRGGIPNTRKR